MIKLDYLIPSLNDIHMIVMNRGKKGRESVWLVDTRIKTDSKLGYALVAKFSNSHISREVREIFGDDFTKKDIYEYSYGPLIGKYYNTSVMHYMSNKISNSFHYNEEYIKDIPICINDSKSYNDLMEAAKLCEAHEYISKLEQLKERVQEIKGKPGYILETHNLNEKIVAMEEKVETEIAPTIEDLNNKNIPDYRRMYRAWKEIKIKNLSYEPFSFFNMCNIFRRDYINGEKYWQEMINNKKEISIERFLAGADLSGVVDEDETPEEYIAYQQQSDEQTAVYESVMNNQKCLYLYTAGFEWIFMQPSVVHENFTEKKTQ